MRTIPENVASPNVSSENSSPGRIEISLKTITPVFGGSAMPRAVDSMHPVRAASVRGHLRFWWRATTGAAFDRADALFKAEAVLWGSATVAGKAAVRVQVTSTGTVAPPPDGRSDPKRGPGEGFFLFPFQESKAEGLPAAPGRRDILFTLSVQTQTDTDAAALHTALRAWLLLGGVGARTRRGLGALTATDDAAASTWLPPAEPGAFREWLRALAGTEQVSGEAPAQMTRLAGGTVLLGERERDALACWRQLGTFWARFRKGHYTPDRALYEPMSGGEWDDHETLHLLRRDASAVTLAKPYLGLPIVYQGFAAKGRAPASFKGALEADAMHGRRMASPVILKPAAFADGSFRSMVTVLDAPRPDHVRIGERVLSLREPDDDPVLRALHARNVRAAVIQAAKAFGFDEEVRL